MWDKMSQAVIELVRKRQMSGKLMPMLAHYQESSNCENRLLTKK